MSFLKWETCLETIGIFVFNSYLIFILLELLVRHNVISHFIGFLVKALIAMNQMVHYFLTQITTEVISERESSRMKRLEGQQVRSLKMTMKNSKTTCDKL